MLRSAPRWHEIAKRVVEITEDAILVGHGVSFDYRMVRQEFERLGYPYERATIDTVNWSRKLFPGEDSYKLTSLCESLGIWLPRNHRAGDDARATLELFRKLLNKDVEGRIRSLGKHGDAREKPAERLQKLLRDVRNEPGIFHLYDSSGELLRAGLAEKMHGELSRIFLSPEAADVEIQHKAMRIQTEPTGTRLLAQIKLHTEERHKSKGISKARGSAVNWDPSKALLQLHTVDEMSEEQLVFLKKVGDGRKLLRYWTQRFQLCPEHAWQKGRGQCGQLSDKHQCSALCNNQRSTDDYQEFIDKVEEVLRLEKGKLQLNLQGREKAERVLIEVENGSASYLFYKLNEERANEEKKKRNRVAFPLDPYIRGLLWRECVRQGPKAVLTLPDSLALNKAE